MFLPPAPNTTYIHYQRFQRVLIPSVYLACPVYIDAAHLNFVIYSILCIITTIYPAPRAQRISFVLEFKSIALLSIDVSLFITSFTIQVDTLLYFIVFSDITSRRCFCSAFSFYICHVGHYFLCSSEDTRRVFAFQH